MSRMNPTDAIYAKLTPEQIAELEDKYNRADAASKIIESYSQERVDRMIQAIAAAVANKVAFLELVEKGVQETRFGDPVSRLSGEARRLSAFRCRVARAAPGPWRGVRGRWRVVVSCRSPSARDTT